MLCKRLLHRAPDRVWRTCLVAVLLVGAGVVYYTVTGSDHNTLQGGVINGVPANKLLQSPFTTRTPSPLLVPNPATNASTSLPYPTDGLHDDLTVVTAYVNLGKYWKGDHVHGTNFTPAMYLEWLGVFGRMKNPVIAYFERQEDVDSFKQIRGSLYPQRTKVYQINRNASWSFSIAPLIREVYATPGYPRYHPGTVMAEYSSAMHLKYELMLRSVQHNPFKTFYFAWNDVGLFRSLTNSTEVFSLYAPPGLNHSKVAYGEVYNRSHVTDIKSIFHLNRIWVCGCVFVGEVGAMLSWSIEYLRATERYLRSRLMNTDQQVVYALSSEGHSTVQAYPRPRGLEQWFHLGYTCKAAGAKRQPKPT